MANEEIIRDDGFCDEKVINTKVNYYSHTPLAHDVFMGNKYYHR
jgi:hypothetical protein